MRDSNRLKLQLLDLDEEERSLKARHRYAHQQLAALRRTNVLNLAFHISTRGPFGVINDQRLGRLSEPSTSASNVAESQVEWAEINAAFGHAVMLLIVRFKNLKPHFLLY